MTTWAIVPVKPLKRGKSRLAGVLTEQERTSLNVFFLRHTLSVLTATPNIEQTIVVSRDPSALALAREFGVRTVHEDHTPDLNVALERATVVVQQYNVHSVLIVPMDLPLLTSVELNQVVNHAAYPPVVVAVPDRHRLGTNILCVSPAGLIRYKFGDNSFDQHCLGARKAQARLEIIESPALALDVDLPEDIILVNAQQPDLFSPVIVGKVNEHRPLTQERIWSNG